ncbi:MAG: leucine-rich repeat domain-containing protein [Candidatus Symbiothrix sp.]|jgi:hypothetical protein|nr:leucine-rich repeat domain-containing protein [Candidatus Symbiothrix sp.]
MKTKKTFLLCLFCLLCSAQVWAQHAWENQHLPIEWTVGDYHFGVQPRWGAGIATGLVTFRGYSGPDDFTNFEIPATAEVPQGVADQFSEMFEGTEFTLPVGTATVKVVGRDAFNGYSAATSIIVPEGVTIIKEAAFSNMNHLVSVSLPHSLESFEQSLFSNSSITAVTLYENVNYIQELAFCYCPITTFTVLCETPLAPYTGGDVGVAANAFNVGGNMADKTLYVPYGTGPAYTAAPIWSEFGTIIELPAPANETTWQGTTTAWNLDANWSDGVPTETTDVIIPAGAAAYPTVPAGTTVAKLTFESGASADLSGTLIATNGVSVDYTVTNGRWYSIGFPFAIEKVYSHLYEENEWDPYELDAYDPESTGTYKGDYWLKEYTPGGTELFQYRSAIVANKGYIVQFPDWFDGTKISFISASTSVTLSNTGALPFASNHQLVANPRLSSLSLNSADDAAKHHYTHHAGENKYNLLDGTYELAPFEAAITLLEPNPSLVPASITIEANTTGIKHPAGVANDPVIATHYYTLQGTEVSKPVENGIYLVKKVHESKKAEVVKIIYKK